MTTVDDQNLDIVAASADVEPRVVVFLDQIYYLIKRIIDVAGATVAIIFCFPIMIVAVLMIKVESKGPILADTPRRVGKDGKLFYMYKFRSMIVGAHDLLHKDVHFKKLLELYKSNSYKIHDDPRVTKVGKFIRKVSIDELPQLFNILKGEMSLVGPRAYYSDELEEQQKKYPGSRKFVKIILTAKPGLTGVWQVSGRSAINFDKRVEMDAEYVQKRSVLYDFWLLFKTIPTVILGRGAE